MKAIPIRQVLRELAWHSWFPLALALLICPAALMYLTHQQQVALVQQRVDTLAGEVDAQLAQQIQGLQALAAGTASQSRASPLWRLHAEAVSYEQSIGLPVALADADRRILLSSARPFGQPLPMLPKAAGPSALDRALQTGKPQVTDLVLGTVSKGPVVAVVVPAPWAPDTKAWISSVSTDVLQRHLDEQTIPSGWTAALVDGNGKVLAARGPDAQTEALSANGAISFTAPVSHARWMFVAHASPWIFYQPQIHMGSGMLVLLSIAGASTLWSVRRSSDRINAAVLRLTDSGQQKTEERQLDTVHLRIAEMEEVHRELRLLRTTEHMAEDRERQRVAQELHDGLQQHMASVKIMVGLAAQRADPVERADLLHRASQATQQAIDELHQIVNDLRPYALDQSGLIDAVQQLSENVHHATGLLIEVESVGDPSGLSSLSVPLLSCSFRVIQECLNNVRKHAQATFVHVVIDTSAAGVLSVMVSDDGIGYVDAWPAPSTASFGLISMRQRVTALGGTLSVSRGQSEDLACGTTVIATMPMQSPSS